MKYPYIIIPDILIPGSARFSPERRLQDPGAWQATLKHLHDSRQTAFCGCRGDGEKRLEVFYRNNQYHVRRAKYSGPDHSYDCVFFAADPKESGQQAYVAGVITEQDNGYSVRLQIALRVTDQAWDSALDPAPSSPQNGSGKTAVSVLGLLHFCWEQARLNLWRPDFKQRIGTLWSWALRNSSQIIFCSRINLTDILVLLAPDDSPKSLAPTLRENRGVLFKAVRNQRRIVVIGEMQPEIFSVGSFQYRYQDLYPVLVDFKADFVDQVGGHLRDHYQKILDLNSRQNREARIMVMIVGEPEWDYDLEKWRVLPIEGAGMLTTNEYIPVESSYEFQVAEQLVEQGRYFKKPLRFDADRDVVFPDFILLDTQIKKHPMEVYGMSTASYLERKAIKEAYYRNTYGVRGHWLWDAVNDKTVPPFPPKLNIF